MYHNMHLFSTRNLPSSSTSSRTVSTPFRRILPDSPAFRQLRRVSPRLPCLHYRTYPRKCKYIFFKFLTSFRHFIEKLRFGKTLKIMRDNRVRFCYNDNIPTGAHQSTLSGRGRSKKGGINHVRGTRGAALWRHAVMRSPSPAFARMCTRRRHSQGQSVWQKYVWSM